MFWFAVAALLPDADVIAFKLGIAYADDFGHRGASHSLFVAPLLAVFPAWALQRRFVVKTWLAMSAIVATHGVLDAMTTGGLGPALLWPFSSERIFLAWRPIPVAPIGAKYFTSERGLTVLATELVQFFLFFVFALIPRPRSGRGTGRRPG